jgi:tRNA modification GTPase
MDPADTIFAVSTAPGRSGVAVVRLSGSRSHGAIAAIAGRVPPDRTAGLRRLIDPATGDLIDEALVLSFGDGKSFTGEESGEFQVHGSPAVVARLLKVLGALPGLRPAEAGEFTRRAVENGRMDLISAEGLADLISAETEAQRLAAQRILDGHLARAAADWRAKLVDALALLTATLDFPDEEVPETGAEVAGLLSSVRNSLETELRGFETQAHLRSGFEVAIIGRPNAGKSTLLNALAGRDMALTSPVAGTTRDILELRLDVGGLPVTFLDTAGLRDGTRGIEASGVARARARAEAADIRIFLLESDTAPLPPGVGPRHGDISVRGKADLGAKGALPGVSGLTGEGVEALLQRIAEVLGERIGAAGLISQARHRLSVSAALARLDAALRLATSERTGDERTADDVAAAIHHLDALVGRVDVEAVLGEVFSRFCIGK